MPVMFPPSYPYQSYSPSPVWQAQPVMAIPQYVQVPVQVQVPVPYPVQVPVPTPMAVSSSPTPTYAVMQTTTTSNMAAPSSNALYLNTVPSPRVTRAIIASPAPQRDRSPQPPAPPPPSQDQFYVVQEQQQQQQQPQSQVYSFSTSSQQQQQQQQQGQSPIFNIYLTPAPQAQPALPGSTPGPSYQTIPSARFESHNPHMNGPGFES